MKKTKKTTGSGRAILGKLRHRPGFRNRVAKTNDCGKVSTVNTSVRDGIFGKFVGVFSPKMTTFERVIVGLMGFCTMSLFIVAMSAPHGAAPQSPKANFESVNAEMETASGAAVRAFKNKSPDDIKHLTVGSLSKAFSTLDYDFATVRDEGASVPRVFVVKMPHDMPHIRVPADRKRLFFKTVLPLVLKINDDILKERQRLLRLKAEKVKTGKLAAADRLWLAALSERYGVNRNNLSEMVRRSDIIPPSLALAQAAEESGWGTSRFAIEGNALFGQWTFAVKGALIPKERDAGKSHGVRAFTSLLDAVRAYVLNLNTHKAYRDFRKQRQVLRRTGQQLTGSGLAPTLTSYSERGEKYVRTIQSIINGNQLHNLDKARLGGKAVSLAGQPTI
jgi:Bax protein